MTILVGYDFETEGIDDFPNYPPKPVGVSIYMDGARAKYYSFGHPTENNCTKEEAAAALKRYWDSDEHTLVAFNRPFDALVAHVHFGLSFDRIKTQHDAMILAFLLDPHAITLELKPLAEKYLSMPPDERDEVRDWLVAHGVCKFSKKKWAEHISKAPGKLVGKYANGDTIRTLALFKDMFKRAQEMEMADAYQRELEIQEVMLVNSIEGIRVDEHRLAEDIAAYEDQLEVAAQRVFKLLDAEPFNINSGEQLANAIDAKVPGIEWTRTPTGKRSVSKDSMEKAIGSLQGELLALLQYIASVNTCVNTFMRVWHKQASAFDGRIRCNWHTTRSDDGGARTGRLSSSPNFQNIPTLKSQKFAVVVELYKKYLEPLGYIPLPNVRDYILPDDDDCVILDRDFSSQELRVLAHFEDDILMQQYLNCPTIDLHQWAADMIASLTGIPLTRKHCKTIAFAVIYGSGLATLAQQLGMDIEQARKIKEAYLENIPGIAKLEKRLKKRARNNEPIRTWGGRVYYVEPPRWDKEEQRWRSFDYKLLNVLIQGSSADITKEAAIEYNRHKVHGRLLLTVHDELVLSVPRKHALTEMRILKQCMESILLDVPLISDGKIGSTLHQLTAFKEAA